MVWRGGRGLWRLDGRAGVRCECGGCGVHVVPPLCRCMRCGVCVAVWLSTVWPGGNGFVYGSRTVLVLHFLLPRCGVAEREGVRCGDVTVLRSGGSGGGGGQVWLGVPARGLGAWRGGRCIVLVR